MEKGARHRLSLGSVWIAGCAKYSIDGSEGNSIGVDLDDGTPSSMKMMAFVLLFFL
jgi:hypothetical protein